MQRPPRLQQKGPLPHAANTLLDELRAREISIPDFAERFGLSRQCVEKTLSGGMKRLSLQLAVEMTDAARKLGVALDLRDWLSRRDDEGDAKRKQRPRRSR